MQTFDEKRKEAWDKVKTELIDEIDQQIKGWSKLKVLDDNFQIFFDGRGWMCKVQHTRKTKPIFVEISYSDKRFQVRVSSETEVFMGKRTNLLLEPLTLIRFSDWISGFEEVKKELTRLFKLL